MNTLRLLGLICVVVISQNTYTGRIFKIVPAWKNPRRETQRVYTRTAWLLKSLQDNSITIGEAANSFHSIATTITQHNFQLGVQKVALFNNMRTLSNLLRIELPSCIGGGYIPGSSASDSDEDDNELQIVPLDDSNSSSASSESDGD